MKYTIFSPASYMIVFPDDITDKYSLFNELD